MMNMYIQDLLKMGITLHSMCLWYHFFYSESHAKHLLVILVIVPLPHSTVREVSEMFQIFHYHFFKKQLCPTLISLHLLRSISIHPIFCDLWNKLYLSLFLNILKRCSDKNKISATAFNLLLSLDLAQQKDNKLKTSAEILSLSEGLFEMLKKTDFNIKADSCYKSSKDNLT